MEKGGWKRAQKADIINVDITIFHAECFKLFNKENWKILVTDGGVYKGKGVHPYTYSIVADDVDWGADEHDGFLLKGMGDLCSGKLKRVF